MLIDADPQGNLGEAFGIEADRRVHLRSTMPRRSIVLWSLAAPARLLLAAGLTLAASSLSSQRIGLSAEPLSAGDDLAPSGSPDVPQRAADTATRTPTATPRATRTPTSSPTPPPARTVAPTTSSGDDNGGGGGSDDSSSGSGGDDSSSGSGGDDSGSTSGSDDSNGGSDDSGGGDDSSGRGRGRGRGRGGENDD